jgi:hypothetical protein
LIENYQAGCCFLEVVANGVVYWGSTEGSSMRWSESEPDWHLLNRQNVEALKS